MPYKRLQIVSFFIFFLVLIIIVAFILKPFVSILALGVMLAILIDPLQKRVLSIIKSPSWAALLALLIVSLSITLLLVLSGRLLVNELSGVYERVQSGDITINKDQIVQNLPPAIRTTVANATQDVNTLLSRLSSTVFNSASAIVSNVAGFFLALFLLLFITFFFLRDGKKIKAALMDLSPLATKQEDILFKRIVEAVNGVIKGQFLMALLQGFVALIGFFIFGLPSPLIWALFTVLAALVPTVGTAITMTAAVLYLLLVGQVPQAIGLGLWGFFAVGLIDNVVGPRVVGSQVRLHPLLMLLSVIGGLEFFGVLGFLIGPIVMAILMATIDIYRSDFKEYFFN